MENEKQIEQAEPEIENEYVEPEWHLAMKRSGLIDRHTSWWD